MWAYFDLIQSNKHEKGDGNRKKRRNERGKQKEDAAALFYHFSFNAQQQQWRGSRTLFFRFLFTFLESPSAFSLSGSFFPATLRESFEGRFCCSRDSIEIGWILFSFSSFLSFWFHPLSPIGPNFCTRKSWERRIPGGFRMTYHKVYEIWEG